MGDRASPTATGECGLVGRYDELAELDAAVGRLQRRQPQVGLEIVGEAGLGKSSLLSELEVRAEAFGATVLHGRASQFERDLPFGALRTALDGLAHGLDGAATALRHETHDHVRGLLSELARDARVLLVLDDLHWADPATLDLVGALIERPPRGAFLLVVAYRPNQLDGTLPPVIATAAARGVLRRIAPRPLDLSCATELLGGQHSHAEVTELHRLCGGNPYFLVETARAVRSGSWHPPASEGATGGQVAIPPLITGALASELLPLSREARELIGAAAVLGDPFDSDLAGAVAELDDAALARAVDQLALVGLVRPAAGPRRFRFRHPLTRQAIHDDLPVGSRRLAHRRAAAVLTAAHADTPTIAHHVAQSAEQGDLEAVAVLEAAGREILPRSPASAAEWLLAAWDLLRGDDRAARERQTLLYPLSVALSVRGRAEEALEILGQALTTVPPGSPEARRLVLGCATVEATTGRSEAALQRVRAVLREAEASEEHHMEGVLMRRLLAVISLGIGDTRAARLAVADALAEADRIGLPQLRTACRSTAALAACLDDDVAEAARLTDESEAEFAAMDDALLPWVIDAFVGHVRMVVGLERGDGTALIERGLRATSDGLRPILAVDLLTLRAEDALRSCDLVGARRAARAACDEGALLADASSGFHASCARALVSAELEPGQIAVDAAEQAVAAARRYGMPSAVALAGGLLGAARLAAGDPARCRAAILHTHGQQDLRGANPMTRVRSLGLLVRASLDLGDQSAADEYGARSDVLAVELAPAWPAAQRHALATRAWLAVHRGDGEAARAAGDAAVGAARDSGAELEALELQLLCARARGLTGDLDGASRELRAVQAVLAQVGAVRLQADAERELRRLGRGPVARRDHAASRGAERLTPRQRQVAELAAAGRSNREIAEALVLSVKTVESHLGAAFTILGVRSRPQLREHLG